MAGIYTGQYIVQENDPLLSSPITVTLTNGEQSLNREIAPSIEVINPVNPLYVRTRGARPFLNYGLGQDRLGGSRIGTLSPEIDLRVTNKVGRLYKVQLSQNRSAWISDSDVESPVVNRLFRPKALSSSWSVYGDNNFDYVKISLSDKLPFRTFQEINPNRIVVDIYGVATNTAWITQMFSTKNISAVNYEQIEDDVLRIFIDLNTKNHWGYGTYYEGNRLVIRVKHEPRLQMRGMRIALDAGHGGAAPGAIGTTGMRESDVNMELVMMVKSELERRGAIVTLTRTGDYDITMARRIELINEQNPDIVVSIHNNAGGNPITTKGVSTYYRHIGYRPLSETILKRMLELDVENFGLVGSFNFALNSITEYPNVLVEGLFMSNPEDEAKLADPRFKRNLSRQIVRGIEDFIKQSK
jgi:N-acetylmuramoyl-L-alanine amidase